MSPLLFFFLRTRFEAREEGVFFFSRAALRIARSAALEKRNSFFWVKDGGDREGGEALMTRL